MESFSTSEIVRSGGCSIIKISPSSGPKYFSFQRQEKNITEVHYSSYLAKINPVSFGVISDRMRNETKKLRIGKKNSGKTKIGEK